MCQTSEATIVSIPSAPAVGRRVPILCDGETEHLLASMECLGSDTRRTLSDPNEGGPCLDGDAALARFEIRLSDADLAMLDDCRRTACSTDEIITACAASVPALAVFADCLRSPEVADRSEVRGLGRGNAAPDRCGSELEGLSLAARCPDRHACCPTS